jgi:hypothetical protein
MLFRYIIMGIVVFASSLSTVVALGSLIRQRSKNDKIKPARGIIWIGLIGIITCLILGYAMYTEESLLIVVPGVSSLLGIYLVLYSCNWEMTLKEDSFIYKNFLGVKKEYRYADVVAVKEVEQNAVKIVLPNKKIMIDPFIKNAGLLLYEINQRLKKKSEF